MKKTNKDFEKWIKKQVEYYKKFLDIKLHKIDVELGKKTEYLSIGFTYPYIDPIIYYSLSAKKEWEENKLTKDRILHELCHIITDPLYAVALDRFCTKDQIENERERLTDTIASIVRNLTQ